MARWRPLMTRRFSAEELKELGPEGLRLVCQAMHAEMARRRLGPRDYLIEGCATADGGQEYRALEPDPDERVIAFDDRGIV